MTYQYKCTNCNKEIGIVKPMSESNTKEYCDYCNKELKRVWEVPSIKSNDGVKL